MNVPIQYRSFQENNSNAKYQGLNLQDPINQNNNNYPSQANINSNNANIYDNQTYHPPNIPTPQSVEVK